jgi:hypothetical protein
LNLHYKDTNKQVWIIIRGSIFRQIKSEDQIWIKEIPFIKLIVVYHQRLVSEIVIENLWEILKVLH